MPERCISQEEGGSHNLTSDLPVTEQWVLECKVIRTLNIQTKCARKPDTTKIILKPDKQQIYKTRVDRGWTVNLHPTTNRRVLPDREIVAEKSKPEQ